MLSVGLAAKMFFLFLLPLAGWLWVKPFLVQAADGNKNKISLNKVKYNSEIFQALLASQKPLADTKGLGISIGNPEGRIRIVKVCNPYCAPCARTHQQIDELLENNKEVEVRIIFFVSPDERDFRNKPVRHLLAIADQGDPQFTHEALNDWYSSSTKDYNAFSKKYRLNEELPRQDQRISDMEAWCRQASISHTPTVFVNGYQLPELYNAEDIRYLFLDNNQTNNTPVNKMKDLSVQ
jgi:protein-disulfide isomerase